jgi:hypothetical protein
LDSCIQIYHGYRYKGLNAPVYHRQQEQTYEHLLCAKYYCRHFAQILSSILKYLLNYYRVTYWIIGRLLWGVSGIKQVVSGTLNSHNNLINFSKIEATQSVSHS